MAQQESTTVPLTATGQPVMRAGEIKPFLPRMLLVIGQVFGCRALGITGAAREVLRS